MTVTEPESAEAPAKRRADAVWEAWATYVAHVSPPPESGRAACPVCSFAETPHKGCEDGIKLYGAYRLTRIMGTASEGK